MDGGSSFLSGGAVRDGGEFGSIIGRNSFQRDRTAVLQLLDQMIRMYSGEMP